MRDLTPLAHRAGAVAGSLVDRLPDLISAMRTAPVPTALLASGAVAIGGIAALAVVALVLVVLAVGLAVVVAGLAARVVLGAIAGAVKVGVAWFAYRASRPADNHHIWVIPGD